LEDQLAALKWLVGFLGADVVVGFQGWMPASWGDEKKRWFNGREGTVTRVNPENDTCLVRFAGDEKAREWFYVRALRKLNS
jgi:hypothetical protein